MVAEFLGKIVLLCIAAYIVKIVYEYVIRPAFKPTLPITRWASSNQPWALVTGGGGGVGRGFGEELARKGFKCVFRLFDLYLILILYLFYFCENSYFSIILLDISERALNECKQAIQSKYSSVQVETKVIDFSKDTTEWIPEVRRLIDQKDIAVLVNNVGINTEIPSLFHIIYFDITLIFLYCCYNNCCCYLLDYYSNI